jgi:hypothetical protein
LTWPARRRNSGCVGRRAEAVGLGAHPTVLRGVGVVPPEEVQEAMCQEHGQLGNQRQLALVGLPAGRGNAHDDVSQETIGAIAVLALVLREREDIGRTILPAIDAIEILDLIVAREENRELAVSHLKSVEHGARAASDVGARDPPVGPFLHDQTHGHGWEFLAVEGLG